MDKTHSHTPGPWAWFGNASAMVYALDETGGVNRFSARVDGGCPYAGRTVKERTSEDELAANARLIAAAPELLEALEMALPGLGGLANENASVTPDYQRARAAIAKATTPDPTPSVGMDTGSGEAAR